MTEKILTRVCMECGRPESPDVRFAGWLVCDHCSAPIRKAERTPSPDAPLSEPKECAEIAEGVWRHVGTCKGCQALYGNRLRVPSDGDEGEFEKWLRSTCFQEPPKHARDLAHAAWGAALRAPLPVEERERIIEECVRIVMDSRGLMDAYIRIRALRAVPPEQQEADATDRAAFGAVMRASLRPDAPTPEVQHPTEGD